MPEPAQTASCPKQLLQRRTADRDAAEDTRPRGKPALEGPTAEPSATTRHSPADTEHDAPQKAQPETDSTTRRHDRPAKRTRETSRDSQAASDLTELAIPAHSRLPADGDAMCSFPLDIENAVLEKSVSAMKGDCQREARML
jgi:hypothetical protein